MNTANKFQVGDIVELKKMHPCGEKRWEVIKIGVTYKLKCLGCGRIIMIPRVDLNKKAKATTK